LKIKCFALQQFTIGDGKNYDDFVYVENVVHGHLCAQKTLSTKEGAMTSGGKVSFYYSIDNFDFSYKLL
jgi:plant 3beta-hydroxysteroid-4alpha-carboxylate 3-dehydrogenase